MDRYEALRGHALNGEAPDWPTAGLTLLLRRGLVAWMRTWSVDTAPAMPPSGPMVAPPSILGSGFGQQMVMLLTNMILAQAPWGTEATT